MMERLCPCLFPALSPRSSNLFFPHVYSGMKRRTALHHYCTTQMHESGIDPAVQNFKFFTSWKRKHELQLVARDSEKTLRNTSKGKHYDRNKNSNPAAHDRDQLLPF